MQAAESSGKPVDFFYCKELLEATGIVTVPGSGFKQVSYYSLTYPELTCSPTMRLHWLFQQSHLGSFFAMTNASQLASPANYCWLIVQSLQQLTIKFSLYMIPEWPAALGGKIEKLSFTGHTAMN